MFERVLKRFREKIRRCRYVMTVHAAEEMDDDRLSVFDVESAILTGRIVERQRDRRTREWKYVVNGRGIDGTSVGVVGKLSPSGHLVILTTSSRRIGSDMRRRSNLRCDICGREGARVRRMTRSYGRGADLLS
jgi:hypothetical protein